MKLRAPNKIAHVAALRERGADVAMVLDNVGAFQRLVAPAAHPNHYLSSWQAAERRRNMTLFCRGAFTAARRLQGRAPAFDH